MDILADGDFWDRVTEAAFKRFCDGLPYEIENAAIKHGSLRLTLGREVWEKAGKPDGFAALADWLGAERPNLGFIVYEMASAHSTYHLSDIERSTLDDAADQWLKEIEDDFMVKLREDIIYAADFEVYMPDNARSIYKRLLKAA